jgi:hypothetical protein
VALAALGQLLGGATLTARRYRDPRTRLRSLRGVAFNAGQACLAVGLAGAVYYSLVTHRAPAPLVAYYRDLIDAGMQYFIVACGRDAEALRLLAEEVIPHVG